MNANRTTTVLTGQLCDTVYAFKINYILVIDRLTLSKKGARKQISLYDTILKRTTKVAVALCVTILTQLQPTHRVQHTCLVAAMQTPVLEERRSNQGSGSCYLDRNLSWHS